MAVLLCQLRQNEHLNGPALYSIVAKVQPKSVVLVLRLQNKRGGNEKEDKEKKGRSDIHPFKQREVEVK